MDVVIIGNGVAGNAAANGALRQPGTKVVLIDGECAPYHSACVLPDYVAGEIPEGGVVLEDRASGRFERWKGKRVSTIRLPEKTILLADGMMIPFHRLVLATGSIPIVPPVPGADLRGNFTLKTLDDATHIRRQPIGSAVVIGSGLIGIEAAIALRKLGHNVTLIEVLDRIGPRILDPVTAQRVQGAMEAQDIHIGLEESVAAVHGATQAEAVETSRRRLEASLVVWATGMKPESGLARDAGITIGKTGGIYVDESMQTSVPEIYAAGDVTEYPDPLFVEQRLNLFWYFGCGQGRVAGMNAAGLRAAYPMTLQMGTARIFDMPLAFVGYTEGELRARGLFPETLDSGNSDRFFHQIFLDGRLVGLQMIRPNRHEIRCAANVLKILPDKRFGARASALLPKSVLTREAGATHA